MTGPSLRGRNSQSRPFGNRSNLPYSSRLLRCARNDVRLPTANCQLPTANCQLRLLTAFCLLLTVFLLSSCKSTSRTASTSLTTGSTTTETNLTQETFHIGDATFTSLTTETITERPAVVLVNGEEKVVTETTTQRQTAVKSTKKDSTASKIDSTFRVSSDTTALIDSLHRETEGMEVIPDIVTGVTKGFFDSIFAGTGRFIVSIILLVLLVILLRYAFKRPKTDT